MRKMLSEVGGDGCRASRSNETKTLARIKLLLASKVKRSV